jgi:WhiB family redox-sensing transcriptional regulator
MTARVQVPGQLELRLDVPELTDELRAELAVHVLDGWEAMGECRSVADDTWFPENGQTALRAAAVSRCEFCPVRRSCLAHALSEGEDYGIWGGATDVQRDALRVDLVDGIPVEDVLDSATIRPAYLWRQTA